MKRFLTGMAAVLLAAILFLPCSANAISAESGIMIDAVTNRVLYERNSDQRSLIASTTKIMTALIVCEQCNVLDRVRISPTAVGVEGSSIYLQEGEVLTVQELLYGLMLHSGNDAAVALAIYCGGTVEGFAHLMNDKAHQLGLKDTHFENPHGLDSPGHYSTARDLAMLTAYAMNNPIFYKTVSAKSVRIEGRLLRNHNKLLWQIEGADGVKTGYTKAAGRILVSSVTRQGRRLITVTMNDPDDWKDHAFLTNEGFQNYSIREILSKGEIVGFVEVAGGNSTSVSLIADENFSYALTDGEKVTKHIQGTGFVYAPTVVGQTAGYLHVCVDGTPVGKIRLVYGDTVEQKSRTQSFWSKLLGGNRE